MQRCARRSAAGEQLARQAPLPQNVIMRPMLATPTATPGVPPSGDEWLHEVKWDGVRALAETVDGALRIYNRSQADVTVAYPEIVAGARGLPDGLLFDCEITTLDPATGVPTLQAIAPRIHVTNPKKAARLAAERPALLVAFDLLRADGEDLTGLPLEERRRRLEAIDLDRPCWHLSETFDDAETITQFTSDAGLEGVMSKRRGSRYQPGARSHDWVKTPHRKEVVAVIGGWIPQAGTDSQLGALWVGHATDEATFEADPVLYPLARVGSGLKSKERDALMTVLRGIARPTPPFNPLPVGPEVRRTHWVEPMVCVQIRYLTASKGGALRQPVLRRLRPDVSPVQASTAQVL